MEGWGIGCDSLGCGWVAWEGIGNPLKVKWVVSGSTTRFSIDKLVNW